MPIGRLFYEIGGDTSRLNEALRQAVDTAKEAGIKITAAGQSIIAKFDEALNPTKALAEQIRLLEAAGKPASDIMTVLGDRIRAASEAAQAHGQPVAEVVQKYAEMGGKASETGGFVESLGSKLLEFARNPLAAARSGVEGLVAGLGPAAAGVAGLAAAAGAAVGAIGAFAASQAEAYEQLENLSYQTGISVGDLQAFKRIAEECGVPAVDLGRVIGKLNEELGRPQTGEFEKALEAMGIEMTDLATGAPKDVVTLLDEMGERLRAIEDPAVRAQVANQALGGRLRELIPILMQCEGGIAAQIAAMREAGVVWDDATQNKLRKLDAALDLVGRAWTALKTQAMEAIGAVYEKLVLFVEGMSKVPLAGSAFVGIAGAMRASLIDVKEETRKTTDRGLEYLENLRNLETASKRAKDAERERKRGLDELEDSIRKNYDAARRTAQEFERMADAAVRQGLAGINEEIKRLAASAGELGTRARNTGLEALGVDLSVSFNPAIRDAAAGLAGVTTGMGRARSASLEFADSMRKEVSTIFTNLEQKLADNILKWQDWKTGLIAVAEDFAKAFLSKIFEFLLTPLENQMASLAGKMSGWLGGLVGGGGGAAGSAAGAAGTAVSCAGSMAAGAAGTAASLGSSLLTGGIAAVGSIVGGAISGAIVRRDTKEIEVNTRYTWLYLDEINKRHYELQHIVWHLDDIWGNHFEWIHHHTERAAGRLDEIHELLSSRLDGAAADAVPQAAAGGRVERTGLAVIHRGETIVPPGAGGDTYYIAIENVYGLDDLDQKLAESLRRIRRRGGLGFLAAPA